MNQRIPAILIAIFSGSIFGFAVSAQEPPTDEQVEQAEESSNQFTGWGFGAGLSVTYDTGRHDRVTEASIDANGIVRINKKENVRARIILETHYFFPYGEPCRQPCPGDVVTAGWGPFVAAQPGEGEVIQAVGLGVMFGWRRPAPNATQSFNLGLGFIVDPRTKILGDEFKEDEPAPLGPEGDPLPLRLPETDQAGILLIASFSW